MTRYIHSPNIHSSRAAWTGTPAELAHWTQQSEGDMSGIAEKLIAAGFLAREDWEADDDATADAFDAALQRGCAESIEIVRYVCDDPQAEYTEEG